MADAADALAVAICHAHFRAGRAQIAAQLQRDAGEPRMIARLRGILAAIGDDHAIVDVAGVGYLVTVAPATLERLPRVGEAVELHTELQLREDGMTLYGFPDSGRPDLVPPAADRAGRRCAGGAVAARHPAPARARQRHRRRRQGDAGAGDRRGRPAGRRGSPPSSRTASAPCRSPAAASPRGVSLGGASGDALSALLHLGYARAEAYAALARVHARLGARMSRVDALVREGLKELTA